jgi:hypothetical protein
MSDEVSPTPHAMTRLAIPAGDVPFNHASRRRLTGRRGKIQEET